MSQFIRIRDFGIVLSGLVIILGAGCASNSSEPTMADAMRQYSDDVQQEADLKRQLAEDWETGNQLERTGLQRVERARKTIEKAEKEIKKAEQALERGNREIEKGRALRAESERRFRSRFPDLSLEMLEETD